MRIYADTSVLVAWFHPAEEWGDELSARFAARTTAGTWDCIHVAVAQHSGARVLATCDAAQAELARLAGLPQVELFR